VDQGEIEALPSLNRHLAHGLEKVLLFSAGFRLNQIENRPPDRQLPQLPPSDPLILTTFANNSSALPVDWLS
jgi:hypothetical protein